MSLILRILILAVDVVVVYCIALLPVISIYWITDHWSAFELPLKRFSDTSPLKSSESRQSEQGPQLSVQLELFYGIARSGIGGVGYRPSLRFQ